MTPVAEWTCEQERPIWLRLSPDPVFAFVHAPASERRRGPAVVLCPPFGWEEMCSHRARRLWARELASAGFPTVRIDLPGAGESVGGPGKPDRLQAWKTAIGGSAAWLRQTLGATRVVAIGIGAGGLAATAAAAGDAPVDDLVLWGVPARGRALVRELRAYAGIVAARYPDAGESDLPEGALEITGFLMSAQTAGELERLDLTKLAFSEPAKRRVLLIERDGLGVDRRLRDHLEQMGTEVAVLEATDYGRLMAHPQEGQAPRATIQASIDWLGQQTGPAMPRPAAPAVADEETVMLLHRGQEVTEAPLEFDTPEGRGFGVLATPPAERREPVSAVLLNAGALRRIGPNRTWVEISRAWAARGIPTLRVDFAGIGDSDGDERELVSNPRLYSPRMVDQTLAMLEELSARGLPDRFVLVGLCSGAYWALHAALSDPRVAGAFMINLYSFHWSEELVAERDRRETVAALRGGVLRRIAQGGLTAYQIRRALNGIRASVRPRTRSAESSQATEVTLALDALREQGTEVLLALSEGEPLYDQFEREGRLSRMDQWPNVTLERLPSSDHMVRRLWLQAAVRQQLDQSLDRVLSRVHAAAAGLGPGSGR